MKKIDFNYILSLLGVVFVIFGGVKILMTGMPLKSANIFSAALALGIILLLGSLQHYLKRRQKEHARKKWIFAVEIIILIIMFVAVINGIMFLILPGLSFSLRIFVLISYIIAPILFIINFLVW